MSQIHMIPYGRELQQVDLSRQNLWGILSVESEGSDKQVDEKRIILDALNHPIGRPALHSLLQSTDSVCVVISDMTRAWQRMSVFLPVLIDQISKAGIPDEQIRFLCATGSHRPMTEDEAAVILGPELHQRFQVVSHDCHDELSLMEVGTTTAGTVVKLNRLALEADHLILTGGIVYHDLAGWGGGKKSILPGIAGYESIMSNHALSLGETPGSGIDPHVRCGSVQGNRLHADMQEAADMVKPSFMLNVLINDQGKIGAAVAGDYREAFEEGKRMLDLTGRVKIHQLAEFAVVSAGGFPKDIDFYQSTKALSSAREAVKKGGVILLLCQCEEGVGHPEVADLLISFASHHDREMEMRRAFTVSKFAGFLASQIAEDYHVYCVTSLDPSILTGIGFQVFQDTATAMKMIEKRHGTGMNTYVIPSASQILPGLMSGKES